jgi:hypothetical protein
LPGSVFQNDPFFTKKNSSCKWYKTLVRPFTCLYGLLET